MIDKRVSVSGSAEAASINMISDDFIHGFPHEGRMSAVRRFFCLFVTFDVLFIGFLWIISIVITGDNIYNAIDSQILHYTIYKSLFDVVVIAVIRFLVLILFYAFLSSSHWIYIAVSRSEGFIINLSNDKRHILLFCPFSCRLRDRVRF